MRLFLLLFGWTYLLIGTVLFVQPKTGKGFTDFWVKGGIRRSIAILPIAFGLLLIWAAPAATGAEGAIRVLGGLALLKGGYFLLAPKPRLERIFQWWSNLSPGVFRLWGVFALAIGVLILSVI